VEYEAVIGLETHVQLKTKSKMWCGCANSFGAEPNTNVCPVCLGMPGVLPVANEEALRLTLLTGLLLNCEIPPRAKFDRKNYFYPDVAKNYQITQYDQPSTKNGFVEFEFGGNLSRVRITRAHLEEDVGKNFHFDRTSGVDFNRAGVPLMEIVSEPDLTSVDQAYDYLNALIEILRYGKISDCDMEKGMVRCDVNVSVRPVGTKGLGAKIEIKNMNSFSGVRRALEYEIPRQIEIVKSGGKLIQSTRRWDDDAGITEEMRTKEHAHDYRYFPEPDLMPFAPTEKWLEEISSRVVELPLARKQRFMRDYQLPASDAETFVSDALIRNDFENVIKKIPNQIQGEQRIRRIKLIANWLINDLRAEIAAQNKFHAETLFLDEEKQQQIQKESQKVLPVNMASEKKQEQRAQQDYQEFVTRLRLKFEPEALIEFVELIDTKVISVSAGKTVFSEMRETGKSPAAIVQEKGLAQVSDSGAIEKFCDDAIAANPNSVADYKNGKIAALNFLKGQVMKLSKGKANPNLVGEILEKKLKS
jgi:aspartyl-tRNA(Asn)/glutamyl-tRNA(Gln) amidotransferase subunit B